MKQILIVEDDSFLNKMLDYNLTMYSYVRLSIDRCTATYV